MGAEMELGLVGWPVEHSQSPEYFSKLFDKCGERGSYSLFPLQDVSELPELIRSHPHLTGFNVTVPYKQAVIPYLDSISREASEIGAVNTVRVIRRYSERHERPWMLEGHNTDYIGFRNSIVPLVSGGSCSALLFGYGGASRAVIAALESLDIKTVVVSRKARNQACGIRGNGFEIIGYSDLDENIVNSHRLLINATPLGMWPNVDGCPPIPWNYVSASHICYDLVYNPAVTMFMRMAANQGATVKNGLEMLHGQADAAWDIWHRHD